MPSDDERLIVLLEARIRDFERNMQKASGTADQAYGRMRRDSKAATAQMEADMVRSTSRINQALAASSLKIGAYGKAFVGGLIGGVVAGGLNELVQKVGEVTRAVADVGRQAKLAGVDLRSFSELSFVAEQARIPVDALADGLKELSLRADEFIATGKGPAAEAFGRLGYGAADLADKLKNPSALFTEIIGKMQAFDKAAQIRIADELFGGTGGERFVQLVEQGAEGIRQQIEYAREMGLVMDEGMLAKAEEADRKFNILATTIGTRLKFALVDTVSVFTDFIDSFREFEAQGDRALQSSLEGVYEELRQAKEDLAAMQGEGDGLLAGIIGNTTSKEELQKQIDLVEELTKKALRIRDILDRRNGFDPDAPIELAPVEVTGLPDNATKFMEDYRKELALTNRERAIAAETQRILNDASGKGVRVTQEQAEALAAEKVARDEVDAAAKRGLSTLQKQIDKANEYTKSLRQYQDDLAFEQEQMFRSPAEQRVYAELRDLGLDLDSIEGQRLATTIRITEELYDQRERAEELGDALKGAASNFLQDLFSGKDVLESIVQIGQRFASMNFDSFVDSVFGDSASMFGGPQMKQAGKTFGQEVVNSIKPALANLDGIGLAGSVGTYTNARLAGATMAQGVSPVLSKTLNPIGVVITKAAQELGISARDLATVISYETGGTFSTSIQGGAGGRHIGLIQFGPNEQRVYGAAIGQALEDQMTAVVKYLKDRGLKAGMDLMDLYSTVNAGRPGLYNRSDEANGGAPGTVADKVLYQMAGHQRKADEILSGIPGDVKAGAKLGTQQGSKIGSKEGLLELSTAKGGFGQAAMGLVGAGLGGFATGYESGNAGMGALGGAMQGWGAGSSLAAMPMFAGMATALPVIGVMVGASKGFSVPVKVPQKPRESKPAKERIAA